MEEMEQKKGFMVKKAGSSVISTRADGEKWCFDGCEVRGFIK